MTLDATPRAGSWFTRWGYLVFLVFVLVGPFRSDEGVGPWLLEGAVILTTVGLYVWRELTDHRGERAVHFASALMVLTLVVAPLGSGAPAVVPIYAAAFIGIADDRSIVVKRLGILTVLTAVAILLSPVPWPSRAFFAVSVVMIWFVGLSVHGDVSLMTETDSLRRENARIQHIATVTERERIARDLHDVAGQTLTAMILRTQLIQRVIASDPDRAREEALAVETGSRELLDNIRKTVSGWQQVSWDDEVDKAQTSLHMAGIRPTVSGSAHGLAPSSETILALVVREAVTNVLRHSGASTCSISLTVDDTQTRLEIVDDGTGFGGRTGGGIRGMHERVLAAGGTLRVDGSNGTRIALTLPVGVGS
jgi:two-component system sensor histidine kinase DesK